MARAPPDTKLTYTIRTVCLSGPRPWQAFVKGERWPSEGRTGRYPSEGMALAAGYVTRKGKTVKVESKVQPRGIPACSSRATS